MSDRRNTGEASDIIAPWVARDVDGTCWAVDRQPETAGRWAGEFSAIYPLPGHHARLVAAAPELLEALEGLVDVVIKRRQPGESVEEFRNRCGDIHRSRLEDFDQAEKAARTAIAKARGE